MTAIYAIILFVLLIFPHELGHFLAAKSVGVKVNEFAFGMGPAVFKKQKGETLYAVRLIPIGGYCAMEGEDEDSEDNRAFNNKPAWAKIFVLFSGAGMNILISVLVLSLIIGIMGTATTTIGSIQKDMPAAEAGMMAGDRIVAIDGEEVDSWQEIVLSIRETDKERNFTVERDGEQLTLAAAPDKSADGNYILGITTKPSHNPFTAVKLGVKGTWNLTLFMFDALKQLITGEVPASELAGPVGIVTMVDDTVKYGLSSFGSLIALMSINLAIMNLLPFPALDGGRIIFVLIRKVTGKKITEEMEGRIHGAGLMMLFALMIFVTWNDIMRLFS